MKICVIDYGKFILFYLKKNILNFGYEQDHNLKAPVVIKCVKKIIKTCMSIYVVAAVVNYVINVCFCNNEDPVSYYIIIKKT